MAYRLVDEDFGKFMLAASIGYSALESNIETVLRISIAVVTLVYLTGKAFRIWRKR